ncbi:hypothetical protein WAI453_008202 [Rhynchosporium graminicola]|uniref:DUF1308 domain-containing protein n=1 Tax=Rhynchosporium graminicola TaxID=2792576 RepID=A0A1E1KMW6_9HELO|nr:uncharacterized protein RCO7_00605 [Rhynchosporium commune]
MSSADTPIQNGSYQSQSNEADEPQLENGIDEKMARLELEKTDHNDTTQLAVNMQRRCQMLLEELAKFQAHLRELKKETRVEVRVFKGGLQSEMKSIDKLAKANPESPRTKHGLRSSNFQFYASVWSTAKTCTSIIGLLKKFYWPPSQKHLSVTGDSQVPLAIRKENHALVDIVSQDGLEWIKVSSVTEKRIIWDLAKAGWVGSDSESDDGLDPIDDDDEPEGLLKQVEALIKASRATLVRNRHPKIKLILPRIRSTPDSKDVSNIISKIRDLGVAVYTSDEISEPPPLDEAILRMAAERFNTFSETLNIDCTILLAFASDLSHGRVEPEHWHNKAISRQIDTEAKDQLLPNNLWPACGSKKMVCTRHAAVRMQEIVETIGTETERKRTKLLMSEDPSRSPEDILVEFQSLTDYPVPKDWALPIQIVDVDIPSIMTSLPPVAEKVAETLTLINQYVFLYGWSNDLTTVSSNGSVAKGMENIIEMHREDETTLGPDVWLSQSSRSLVGKEKHRRGFSEKGLSEGYGNGDTDAS